MLPVRYNTSFVLHRKDGEDVHRLEFRVRWNNSRCGVALSVGFAVDPQKWDGRAQRCAPRSLHGARKIPAAVINREADRFVSAADAVFKSLCDADIWPTPTEVRRLLRLELGIDAVHTCALDAAFTEYLRYGSAHGWTDGTVKKYRTLLSHLKGWNGGIELDGFTTEGLDAFVTYLMKDCGMRNSTIERDHGLLRAFLRWCDEKHYLHCRDYQRFSLDLTEAPQQVVFLTWEELMRLWSWEPAVSWWGHVRDVFCFCAFTGLRYSDAQNLRWADVTETTIRVVSKKDVDGLVIDLNKWSEEILYRYVDEAYPDGRVLPPITNQVMNRTLKDIMKDVGITSPVHTVYYKEGRRVDEMHCKWELVGTHTARRTFICNALAMGIPATTVMKWTGHSDYNAMKPYINVADREKALQMAKFDKKNGPTVSP